jgi:hypothetical protein
MADKMTESERRNLIALSKLRAKQAASEVEAQEAIHLAAIEDQLTVEFSHQDALWAEAVILAEEALAKANSHIREQCASLGIPAADAPQLHSLWSSRSSRYALRSDRAELRKLAVTRLAALTKMAKAQISEQQLDIETKLRAGALESADATAAFDAMKSVAEMLPALELDDLGVKRWTADEETVARLLTPFTPTDRQRRRVLRVLQMHPVASHAEIAAATRTDVHRVAAIVREHDEQLQLGEGSS